MASARKVVAKNINHDGSHKTPLSQMFCKCIRQKETRNPLAFTLRGLLSPSLQHISSNVACIMHKEKGTPLFKPGFNGHITDIIEVILFDLSSHMNANEETQY